MSNTSSSLYAEVQNFSLNVVFASDLPTCIKNIKCVDNWDHCVSEFCVKRDPKWGGDKIYTAFEEVEKEFAEEVTCRNVFI